METDEELARRLQEEYDEAARASGDARELRRRRESAIAADEAVARRLQAEEALGVAFGGEESDADETEDADDARVIGRGRSAGEVLGEAVLGRLFGALAGRGAGGRDARGAREDADAEASRGAPGGETRSALEFEIPIGPNGQSVRFGTNVFGSRGDPFVEALDDLIATMGRGSGRTSDIVQMPSIIDMLNAMQGVLGGVGGGGAAGLSEEQREAVPTRAYERQRGETENATCSVCLSQLEDGEPAKTLGCKHVYHPECINRWLERSRLCPVCKRDVLTGEHEHS